MLPTSVGALELVAVVFTLPCGRGAGYAMLPVSVGVRGPVGAVVVMVPEGRGAG
jgi:hypothetical protein